MLRYIDKDEFMERAVPDYEERKERKKLEQTTNLTPAERIAKARELMASGMGEDEAASAAGYGKAGNMKKAMARLGKKKQPLASEQETKGIPGLLGQSTLPTVSSLPPVSDYHLVYVPELAAISPGPMSAVAVPASSPLPPATNVERECDPLTLAEETMKPRIRLHPTVATMMGAKVGYELNYLASMVKITTADQALTVDETIHMAAELVEIARLLKGAAQ